MPQLYNKLNAEPINAGRQWTKIRVYDPARGVDSQGGVLRFPAGGGGRPGTPLFDKALSSWDDYCAMEPYGAQARPASGSEVSVSYATMVCSYMPTKPYVDGMIVQVVKTGEWFNIEGVENISDENRKTQLTCRRAS